MKDTTLVNVISKRILTCEKIHPGLIGNPDWQKILQEFRSLTGQITLVCEEEKGEQKFVDNLVNLERKINNFEEQSRLTKH